MNCEAVLGGISWCISILISVLLVLKIYEFIWSLIWTWLYGADLTTDMLNAEKSRRRTAGLKDDELREILVREILGRRPSYRQYTQSVRMYILTRLPFPLKKIFGNLIFRFPTLVIAQIGVILLSSNALLVFVGITLLLVGLWIETLNILSNRINMGYTNRDFSITTRIDLFSDIGQPDVGGKSLSRPEVVKEFARLFASMIALVIIGYAGVYVGFHTLLGEGKSFSGLNQSGIVSADLLYFSVTTLATVGFGDICAVKEATILRIVIASQIMLSMLLLIFLVASFSWTAEHEYD